MAEKFSGVHWMLATPFHEDESIDLPGLGNLVDKAVSQAAKAWSAWASLARLPD